AVAAEHDDRIGRARRELRGMAAPLREHGLDLTGSRENFFDRTKPALAHARRERVDDQEDARHAAIVKMRGRVSPAAAAAATGRDGLHSAAVYGSLCGRCALHGGTSGTSQ